VILDIETAARVEFVRVEYDVDEAMRGIRASDLPSDFAEFVVAATGHLGGAHVNPAVTIALCSVRRFPAREVVPYVLAQCGGAAVAVRPPLDPRARRQPRRDASGAVLRPRVAVEFGYSALLAFLIMAVATDERAPAGVAPLALGATVSSGALVTGPLTGGSFNPARSLGPALAGGGWAEH